ncbi:MULTISPECIES: hypothetical protein [Protofrankia]|uniref:TetR family transcriptional regulator n=1 Tax=Protofrankia coriariae TaxID=1562887 RepID=A0ABR5F466_9ACTN|nr:MULTISPECIES: hypothetical protein [Protofrankia]KLL11479.1 hypothetical protein FrCorBMG51_10330 [Protofrankia coriariae]ONH34948.1 hypothetical protein BL254_13380 [Protofrankia sp. BMG5.30]
MSAVSAGLCGSGDAVVVAGYLTAVADHWAEMVTLADRTGEYRLRVYAAAVDAEARVRVAQAQARAAGAPGDELADVFDLVAAVTLDRIAAWYQAGRPCRPAGLTTAERALTGASRRVARSGGSGWPLPAAAVA